MNREQRKLVAAFVIQRAEMGEREWYFNPVPFLTPGPGMREPAVYDDPPSAFLAPGDAHGCGVICPGPAAAGVGEDTLEELRETVGGCHRCPLGATRRNFVFGSGNPRADVMFVGEAPGADEDEQGLPFVGRAGQLLTKMIESIKLRREDVYITNVLKCRPPGNRDPIHAEIEKCEPILIRQIEIIRPKIICALGRISGKTLLHNEASLGALRGKVHDCHGVKLVVTYHPAALLRNPHWKRPTWEDLKFLRREYDGVEVR